MLTYIEIAVLAIAPIAVFSYLVFQVKRYRTTSATETLGRAAGKTEVLTKEIRTELLRQQKKAFGLLFFGGVGALVVLCSSFVLVVVDSEKWPYSIIQAACGLGEVLISKRMYSVWKILVKTLTA